MRSAVVEGCEAQGCCRATLRDSSGRHVMLPAVGAVRAGRLESDDCAGEEDRLLIN